MNNQKETMVKGNLTKVMGGILLGVALLVALAACGGSSEGTTQMPPTPQANATSQPTATASPPVTASLTPTPTQSKMPPATSVPTPMVSAGDDDLLAKGKLIFEKTAGGVGCASCHGLDGKGNPQAGIPANRGKTEGQLRQALEGITNELGGVPPMAFIKLTDAEITAVVAYLRYLNEQP